MNTRAVDRERWRTEANPARESSTRSPDARVRWSARFVLMDRDLTKALELLALARDGLDRDSAVHELIVGWLRDELR